MTHMGPSFYIKDIIILDYFYLWIFMIYPRGHFINMVNLHDPMNMNICELGVGNSTELKVLRHFLLGGRGGDQDHNRGL